MAKMWFKSLKDARKFLDEKCPSVITDGIYRQKQGSHKGQYFVGSYIDFINKY